MDRYQALRQADCWRIEKRVQKRGSDKIEEFDSINKAKQRSRSIGRCVVLHVGERGHGTEQFGFFLFA